MTVNQTETPASQRWPGWPGDNVFRMIVPVVKVGGIIGKGGELIKKLCEETGARVRVLDGPLGTADRVVLISGREEPEAKLSPAMEAVLRVFKRMNGLTGDGRTVNDAGGCAVRLLMASVQAIHLIGKQGSSIKSIQEESGALINVLTGDERAFYASPDERIVDVQGEPLKVLKALEAIVQHLRKFLVDHSMIAVFEKGVNKPAADSHAPNLIDRNQSMLHSPPQQTGMDNNNFSFFNRDSLYLDREREHDPLLMRSELSPYRQEPAPGLRSSGLGRLAGGLVTHVTQTMQFPLMYAEDIIGADRGNISLIRSRSGARVLILEGDAFDEMVIEIKGTPTQVQTAQQLIEDSIAGHKEPAAGGYSSLLDRRSGPTSFPQFPYAGYQAPSFSEHFGGRGTSSAYPSSSGPMQTYGGYGYSGSGDYDSYRY